MVHLWMESVDPGVSVIFQTAQGVTKIKKIRFSKRKFTADRAQNWWRENQQRLVRDYNLVPGATLGDQNPFGRTGSSIRGEPAVEGPTAEDPPGAAAASEPGEEETDAGSKDNDNTELPSMSSAGSKPVAEEDDPDQSVQSPGYSPGSGTLPQSAHGSNSSNGGSSAQR